VTLVANDFLELLHPTFVILWHQIASVLFLSTRCYASSFGSGMHMHMHLKSCTSDEFTMLKRLTKKTQMLHK